MEILRIAVDVNINLSENTREFFRTICVGPTCGGSYNEIPQIGYETENPKAEETKSARKPRKPKVEKTVEPEVPAEEIAEPETPAEETVEESQEAVSGGDVTESQPTTVASLTIEDLRSLLSQKVGTHREAIKEKLAELGSPSVSRLDTDKYEEFYAYLQTLE